MIDKRIILIFILISLFSALSYAEDFDEDGMPDDWERIYGLKIDVVDSNEDPDYDYLINIEEFNHETNPIDPDSDNDGVLDKAEIDAGTNPRDNTSYPIEGARILMNLFLIILGIIVSFLIFLYIRKLRKNKVIETPQTSTIQIPRTRRVIYRQQPRKPFLRNQFINTKKQYDKRWAIRKSLIKPDPMEKLVNLSKKDPMDKLKELSK